MSSLSSLTHTTCSVLSDSSYTFSSKVASEISEKISDKFSEISDYMASHGLKLNGDKTHLMLLMSDESRRAKPNFDIYLDTSEEVIQPTKSEKLLGGIIGQNLKFTDHIQNNDESMLKLLKKVSKCQALRAENGCQ